MASVGNSNTSASKVRVLVVDDSASIRNVLRHALARHPQIEVVGLASDGVEALQKIAALRPDVVTLDVEMPRMNGLAVLERAAGKVPVSFVMVSTLTQTGAQITFEALRRGAFDYVPKPEAGALSALPEFRTLVQAKVLAAARAKGRPKRIFGRAAASVAPSLPPNQVKGWVVAIGISCGGPPTLTEMLPAFPSDFVPILVIQHMPAQFTTAFAKQLNDASAMKVREAEHGELLQHGTVLIAPGDRHLKLTRSGVGLRVILDASPKVSGHRPSADVMFAALAHVCAPRCVGIVMTGMGGDGAEGVVRLSQAGAWTIAQDEASSLVYGMPKVAQATGCIDHVAPFSKIPELVARLINAGVRSAVAS